jgi:biopolymer transport protein ExbD
MKPRIQAEINVTPLVDVCLVLLIIFMVVTPLMEHAVELPQAESASPWPAEPARSKVTLAYADGTPPAISLDNDPGPLSEPAFQELIRALYDQNPRREILVRADRRLAYGEVKRVLGYVRAAGFSNVGLVAERAQAGPR